MRTTTPINPNRAEGDNVTDHELQRKNGIEIETDEEGYYSMYHSGEEFLYGPKSPLSAKYKVFSYLKHSELRWPEGHPAGLPKTKQQVSQATGLTIRQIEVSVRSLTSSFVERIEKKVDGVFQPTTYRINRTLISKLRVPKMQKLTLIQGGGPTESGKPPHQNGEGVPPNQGHKTDLSSGNDSGIREVKQSVLKQRDLNNKTNSVESFSQGISWEKARQALLEEYPSHGRRLDEAYNQLTRDGVYFPTGAKIQRPAGFLLKSWHFANEVYAYIDQTHKQQKEEEVIDWEAADRARELAMKSMRRMK